MVGLGFGSLTLSVFLVGLPATAEQPRVPVTAEQPATRLTSTAAAMSTSQSTGVKWHESIQSGWAESKRRSVPMVIFVTRSECRYCDAMKKETWCDDSIGKQLADDFVAIRLTPTQNAKELNRINVELYPMTLIGIPEGKIVDKKLGYQPAGEIRNLLAKARNRIKHR